MTLSNTSKFLVASVGLILANAALAAPSTTTLTVEVKGLRSDSGKVAIQLYSSEDGFPISPEKAKTEIRSAIKNGSATAEFKDLPNGWYAVALYHDENDNKKCDTNFIGIPKEGLATSNNAHLLNMIAKYAKAKVELTGTAVKIVVSEVKY